MRNREEYDIGYKIIKIQTAKFSFEDVDKVELDEMLENDVLSVSVNVGVKIDREDSIITVDVLSRLFNSKDRETGLVVHKGRTLFQIFGLDQRFNETEKTFDLPEDLMIQLYRISYTHARALLAMKLNDTVYGDKYFLPVVNPKELLPENPLAGNDD